MSLAFDGARLDIAGLAYLSAQHYPLPAGGVITTAMPSCGALPMHVADTRRVLVPVHDGDALWFGLTAIPDTGVSARAIVETARHGWLDIISGSSWNPLDWGSVAVPPATALDGIRRHGGGMWPFAARPTIPCAPACRRLQLYLGGLPPPGTGGPGVREEVRIALSFVRPAAYRRLTGADPGQPADPRHQFGKYLLA